MIQFKELLTDMQNLYKTIVEFVIQYEDDYTI